MKFETDYQELLQKLEALTDGIPYLTSNLANTAALIWQTVPGLNWAGFYEMTDGALVLGPFQGKPACVRIAMGKGVCGTAAQQDKSQLVYNVHDFPGHIACDSASNAEVVIPLHAGGKIWGVLDIDSPTVGRFTPADLAGLEQVAQVIEGFLLP